MALWDKINNRGDVEDRRMTPTVGTVGLGLTGVVIITVFTLLSGGNASDVMSNLQSVQVQSPTEQVDTKQFEGTDSYEEFVSTVLGSTNDTWSKLFTGLSKTYTEPKLVLFRNSTQSACGGAQSVVGPHYCPADETIYLDETFFNQLTTRFGAKGGDVAEAYVIAHEVGHHVQQQLGITDQVENLKNNRNSNELSVKLELQADCFGGLWAYTLKDRGIFEKNEITEAMDAASAVGDDHIEQSQGVAIRPETWTHGSGEERVAWFTKGYNTGALNSCDTFK